jgi:hypothetical protein
VTDCVVAALDARAVASGRRHDPLVRMGLITLCHIRDPAMIGPE